MSTFTTIPNPSRIFANTQNLQNHLVAKVTEAISRQTPLPNEVLERLRYYPHLLKPFVQRALIPDSVLHHILNGAPQIFLLLMADYEGFKRRLEPHLYNDLECVERLTVALQEAASYGVEIEPLIEDTEEYYKMLSSDPNRLLRVSLTAKEEMKAELLTQAEARFLDSAAWAYFLLENSGFQSVAPEIIETISLSEEYSCRTLCTQDGLTGEQVEKLAGSIVSPKWACHALKNAPPPPYRGSDGVDPS